MLANLFPLELRAFEELFVRDDRPDFPAVFSARFVFSGPFDHETAKAALTETAGRQPMMNVRLSESDGGSAEWIQVSDAERSHSLAVETDCGLNRLLPVNVKNEKPFRLNLDVRQTEDGKSQSVVTFQFHHAAFDGVGGLMIVNDWMRAYDRLSEVGDRGVRAKRSRLDPGMLQERCRAGLTWRERVRLAPWSWLSLIGFVNFFKNRPIPLLPNDMIGQIEQESDREREPILSIAISQQATSAMKSRATELSVTMNDLLAVELLASVKQWQQEMKFTPDGSHIRITIPINERNVRHRRMPACNHCTMISLDRRPDHIDLNADGQSFQNLAKQVHHEIKMVRDWRLSLFFWTNLRLFRRLGGIKRWFATQQCRSTCVLTNLGQLGQRLRLPKDDSGRMVVGGNRLLHVELAAPIRYGTAAAFSIFMYRGQLNITMNFDDSSLRRESATALLETIRDRLDRSLSD